ncbi:MAG: aromatic-L-amino-acid/L-tryptophan decarboxylase [Acidobacteriota bacterium]|jgi:glutamate/tyrosine decarboxylase-like PLP-dependent enzyme|nr:aromatic-L-amino-acid/L-tryptophan decarboxylase [Acidobacteriota bacterium]
MSTYRHVGGRDARANEGDAPRDAQSTDGSRASSLDLPPEELNELASAFQRLALGYLASPSALPVFPETTAERLVELFRKPLPVEGVGMASLERDCAAVFKFSRQNGHPRMFGYVASPASPVGVFASLLAAALNTNVTSWRSAPAPTEVERTVVGWLAELIGYTSEARGDSCGGLLTSGGSMANLNALFVAHRTHARRAAEFQQAGGAEFDETGGVESDKTSGAESGGMGAAAGFVVHDPSRAGLWNAGAPMTVYASDQVHLSIPKAVDILGLGREQVRVVPSDEAFRMDVRLLRERIEADERAGLRPFCIVASAGTVSTGAVDPLGDVAKVARERSLWFHVDGAYGALAASVESKRPLFEGLAEADSVSLDPHKWLYAPLGAGCLLFREPGHARAAFAGTEEGYIKVFERQEDEAFAFWNYGTELSRPFRALKVWAMLSYYGSRRVVAAIAEDCALAEVMAERVRTAEDFELLAPVALGICCFRYVSKDARRELEEADEDERERINVRLDKLNVRVMNRVQRGGDAYVSNAILRGRFALRASITNFRTTRRDLDITLDAVRRAARELEKE